MGQNIEAPAVAPAEPDTPNTIPQVEAQSLSLDGKSRNEGLVEGFNQESLIYIEGWRLHLLILRSVCLHYLEV